jgi:hypothetical protein
MGQVPLVQKRKRNKALSRHIMQFPMDLLLFMASQMKMLPKTTKLTETDLNKFKVALWKGVRESVKRSYTHQKEQQPRLFIKI